MMMLSFKIEMYMLLDIKKLLFYSYLGLLMDEEIDVGRFEGDGV
jgi:hypothetical protein